MVFNSKLLTGTPEQVVFDHNWSRCDLDLWPFNLSQNLTSSSCPKLHLSCKFGEIPTNSLLALTLAHFYYMMMMITLRTKW